ncbi:MAG: hypothetical protein AAB214_13790 [Fibrobacterota bacterium]
MTYSVNTSLLIVVGALGIALTPGCSWSGPRQDAKASSQGQPDSLPLLDSLSMRKMIQGRWIQDSSRVSKRVLKWASYPVSQVLIEPFHDRKDPTVRKVERALAAWGHADTEFRSPTSILANIRVRFQRADSVDIDTLLVSGEYYPKERSIDGETMGARVKGQVSFRLVGEDRLLVKGFPYLRVRNPASP